MPEIGELFDNMPLYTKTYVISSLVLGLLVFIRLMSSMMAVVYIPDQILHPKFILSYFFLGKLSVGLLFELYFFTLTVGRLEMTYKPTRYAEFFYMILTLSIACYLCEIAVNYGGWVLLSKSYMMALTYVYCKRNPNEKMYLMYFIQVKASYLPWALIVLDLLNENTGSIYSSLIGILVGHLYVYLKDILPVSHKRDYMTTPQWMIRFVAMVKRSSLPIVGNGGAAQAFGMNQEGHRIFAGRGRRIA